MLRSRNRFVPALSPLENRNLLSMTPISAQVLAFAQAHVNKQVGDGQCATLAADAVAYGGSVPFYRLSPTGTNAAYVWGRLVTTLTPTNANTALIRPGDILQFKNVVMVDTMKTTNSNGSTQTHVTTEIDTHHTAIVSAIDTNTSLRNDLEVLESNVQNSPFPLRVQWGRAWGGSSTYVLRCTGFTITTTHTMTSGAIMVYRPYKT